ncbi:amidohydrolase family protein [Novosphingobium sp. TH158]|uniref:amidohydrolase family protein n=1 Tax=Novosphingobium sp. TH158 TaxID=2067455 RepID=UPI000C7C50CD|nr:amidohydrolase family protein [Novosphingobium sp. TH158]PLK27072.1 amidohydrolase [Novosphingobium sp. TH158]
MSARATTLAATALLSLVAAPALGQSVAVTNATLVIGDGSAPIKGGTVLVSGGKVVAAGTSVAVPAGTRMIDAGGKYVTPGIVVAVTDLGLVDVESDDTSNDTGAAKAPFGAALDYAPVINPSAQPIAISRAAGVTRAAVVGSAGSSIFAGQGAVIDLGNDPAAVVQPRAFQYVELGEDGGRIAGGSRVAAHTALRNALAEARDLARRHGPNVAAADMRLSTTSPERPGDALLNRFDAAALVPVVNGLQPLYVRAERASDIRAALALKNDFPLLKLVIVGATEGWLAAADLVAARVPVIASPLRDLPSDFEHLAATQSNVGRMAAAGVKVSLGAFFDQPRHATQYAGNLVGLTRVPRASGLTWAKALAAITSGPAEAIGMGDKFGSLKPGKAGDLVIWDGDPLEMTSGVVSVFIDGVEQPLDNHQSRLRDRYKTPQEGVLPKAYDW